MLEIARHKKVGAAYGTLSEAGVMKCANPNCDRGIGLVCHQRHSFDKLRFCSKKCRDESWTRNRNGSDRNFIPRATSSGFCRDRPRI